MSVYERQQAPPTEAGHKHGRIHDLLVGYGPIFTDIRERWERGQVNIKRSNGEMYRKCGSHALEAEFRTVEAHMNDLLEQYHAELLGAAALDGVPHEAIIAEHAEQAAENGRGTE